MQSGLSGKTELHALGCAPTPHNWALAITLFMRSSA
jgi:hypothetical protein